MQAHAEAEVVAKPLELEAARCWRAVLARDGSFDGRFVYAVETTTVYCRPSCPSRRPLRKNVRFLPTAAAAERRGYRACRRCRPDAVLAPAAALVERIRRLLLEEAPRPPTLAELAQRVSLSPAHLQRLFKRHTGMSPKAYVDARRFQHLKEALREEDGVSAAIYAAGYQAPSRAYEKTHARLGMTPSVYRAGGAGQTLTYAIARSSLGRTLVATTSRGVCRVAFGASDAALLAELRAEYPKAELVVARSAEERWVQEAVRSVDAPGAGRGIALDLHGTAFQLRVWKALQAIPPGETASYQALAKRIRAPGAVRAVASACAANKVAVLVPCHRVIRADGGVGGYRWGVARKERLLQEERGPR
jgi:AraC family transcriptional regulator, regulatory protein of adaptative response / methylated-DNA-[protein]-cysteine methyltransferase